MQGEFYLIVVRFAFLPLAKIKVAPCCGARCVPWRNTPALHTDRGHSLWSLYPPPAALPSLPSVCTGSGRTDSLFCGKATAVATVPRTVAKSRLSNPSSIQKVQHQQVLDFLWWGRTDSNHRSDTQQIYSLSPLATRELPHIQFSSDWSR